MSSSFYMILDMLVAMAALGYGGPLPRDVVRVNVNNLAVIEACDSK